VFIFFFFALKARPHDVLKLDFCQIKLEYRTTDKLAISWQNFSQVGLQLKLTFRIRPLVFLRLYVLQQVTLTEPTALFCVLDVISDSQKYAG